MRVMTSGWGLMFAFKLALQIVGAAEPSTTTANILYGPSTAPVTPAGRILLARTAVAPFSALGSAIFLSGFDSTNTPMLLLELRGVSPGQYQLGIVRESDESFVSLAKFSIVDPTVGPDRDANHNTKTTTSGRQSEQLVSQNVIPLARVVNPRDVAKLVVADALGNYLLVANLHPAKPRPGGR